MNISKKTGLALLLTLGLALPALSQNIALGEKVPEIRSLQWHEGRQPAAAPLTYVEFFHTAGKSSLRSLERLAEISRRQGKRLAVVVVSSESPEKTMALIGDLLTPHMYPGFDPEGAVFKAYGVSYLPFGVLVDARSRALWMGNTLQLDQRTIDSGGKR